MRIMAVIRVCVYPGPWVEQPTFVWVRSDGLGTLLIGNQHDGYRLEIS
jgi:hypothetical protein